MSGLRDLKLRIKSVKSTKQITKAMNLVSTIKYKKAKDKVEHARIFLNRMKGNIQAVSADDYRNALLMPRDVKKTLFVVIASDRGLCGAFNSSIIKKANNAIEDKNVIFITVGHKARDFFVKRRNVVDVFSNNDNVSIKQAAGIAQRIISLYNSGEVDEVYLFYNEFISTIKFEPTMMKLLPLEMEKEEKSYYSYDAAPGEILDMMLPKYISAVLFERMLEAAAAEQSSRMTAMNNATENATKIIDELSMEYNRVRQASITNEISEIVGGTEALK